MLHAPTSSITICFTTVASHIKSDKEIYSNQDASSHHNLRNEVWVYGEWTYGEWEYGVWGMGNGSTDLHFVAEKLSPGRHLKWDVVKTEKSNLEIFSVRESVGGHGNQHNLLSHQTSPQHGMWFMLQSFAFQIGKIFCYVGYPMLAPRTVLGLAMQDKELSMTYTISSRTHCLKIPQELTAMELVKWMLKLLWYFSLQA